MRTLLLLFLTYLSTSLPANASMIGLDISSDGTAGLDSRDFTIGYKFSLSEDALLTSLGTWDQDSDGLNVGQTVRLWRSSGELLATAWVDNTGYSDVSLAGQGSWLFKDIDSVLLNSGEYIIGADRTGGSGDAFQFGNTGIVTDSRVVWQGSQFSFSNNFGLPLNTTSGSQYFGPNFKIAGIPVSVPEPATIALLSLGLIGLRLARKAA